VDLAKYIIIFKKKGGDVSGRKMKKRGRGKKRILKKGIYSYTTHWEKRDNKDK
jgi:hypothetical protein